MLATPSAQAAMADEPFGPPLSTWWKGPVVAVATVIVVIIPEKLQVIQEYRFLLYAAMVMAVLLFRPEGLLPRPVRRYFPGWRP